MTQQSEQAALTQDHASLDPAVEEAIVSRRSIRRFLPQPVPRETVAHLLEVAARAPSGTNIQPWRVYVLQGAGKDALSEALVDAYLHHADEHEQERRYYPQTLPEPFLSRRREVGWALYGLVGIERGDKEGMRAQHALNYRFFGAPVGLICTIDRVLEIGSWLDYGMFLQNVMVAARGAGLHTCPQAAFSKYHAVIREHLPVPQSEIVVCGMSLGYADESAPENTLVTRREPLESFVTFL